MKYDEHDIKKLDFIIDCVLETDLPIYSNCFDKSELTLGETKDDKDGKKVYVTEILASNTSFLDSKGTGATGNTSFNNLPEPPMVDTSSNNMETVSVEKDPFEAFGDSIEISDNDLPF